eukprot:CAMPEP_0178919278 /NCGR_PEP_ID=MMETSP0786-20121207/14343_1 /TAXON_ID=186022 /ORGANISM="Thalassionema frauenfeldii, Strain CCMP 1798" /LENGTH=140 /DNA_ID=CAMNT_0020593181 /DNA_START=791 /DNA_END=1210 /DNA_ORIENTATION=+
MIQSTPFPKRRKVSHLVEVNNAISSSASICRESSQEGWSIKIEEEEIPLMVREEDDGVPFLEIENETSLPLHISKTTSKPQSPSIIKPNPQHFRGKDLNRLLQNYMHGRPLHNSSKSCPSIQRMEVCMGRQFYPIYSIPE